MQENTITLQGTLVLCGDELTVFSLFPRDMLSILAETPFPFVLFRGERVDSIVTLKVNKITTKRLLISEQEEVWKFKKKKRK